MPKLTFRYLRHLLTFPLFFMIFYVEGISFGGVRVAIIWKTVLIGFIITYIFVSYDNLRTHRFVLFGGLYSLKNFISLSSFQNWITTSSDVMKNSFIPLFFQLLARRKAGINFKDSIYNFILSVSVYIILSSIPFLLGILEPLGIGYDLSIFGLDDQHGFVGIFQGAHSAAVTIASALIVLIYHIQRPLHLFMRLIYWALIILGIWVEIQTFARTGYAIILIVGSYLILSGKRATFYLKLTPLLIIVMFAVWQYYLNSEVMQMRIVGTNKYMEQSGNSKDSGIGSGRDKFAFAALDNLYSSGPLAWVIGLGEEKAKDMMLEDVGIRVYAHNGFFDVLQFNGIMGVILYLLFLYNYFNYIRKRAKVKYAFLAKALFIAYVVQMLLQGEHFFLPDVILAMSTACLENPSKDALHIRDT